MLFGSPNRRQTQGIVIEQLSYIKIHCIGTLRKTFAVEDRMETSSSHMTVSLQWISPVRYLSQKTTELATLNNRKKNKKHFTFRGEDISYLDPRIFSLPEELGPENGLFFHLHS